MRDYEGFGVKKWLIRSTTLSSTSSGQDALLRTSFCWFFVPDRKARKHSSRINLFYLVFSVFCRKLGDFDCFNCKRRQKSQERRNIGKIGMVSPNFPASSPKHHWIVLLYYILNYYSTLYGIVEQQMLLHLTPFDFNNISNDFFDKRES